VEVTNLANPRPKMSFSLQSTLLLIADLDPDRPKPFNSINYSDDLAGCETSLHRATAAFTSLGDLLKELGLKES
jgi:hypothetical protein